MRECEYITHGRTQPLTTTEAQRHGGSDYHRDSETLRRTDCVARPTGVAGRRWDRRIVRKTQTGLPGVCVFLTLLRSPHAAPRRRAALARYRTNRSMPYFIRRELKFISSPTRFAASRIYVSS